MRPAAGALVAIAVALGVAAPRVEAAPAKKRPALTAAERRELRKKRAKNLRWRKIARRAGVDQPSGAHVEGGIVAGEPAEMPDPVASPVPAARGAPVGPVAPVAPLAVSAPAAPRTIVETRRRTGRLAFGIVFIGAGSAAVGIASYAALQARADYREAIGGCPAKLCVTQEDYDATQQARRTATRMSYVGAGGGVLALVGAVLLFTSRSERTVEVAPVVGASTGVSLGGRW